MHFNANKCGNLDELYKFIERYNLAKLTQEIENLNSYISVKEIELIIKYFHTKKTPSCMVLLVSSVQHF